MGLGTVGIGARQQHQHVGACRERAPRLDAVDHPAVVPIGPDGRCRGDLQAGDVAAEVRLGDSDRHHHLGGGQLGQPVLLLRLGAALHQRSGQDLGPSDQRAADAQRSPAQLFGGDHHADVLAVAALAVAAVLGGNAEAEDPHLGQTADQFLGHVGVVPVHVLGARNDLIVGERAERVLHHLVVGVEVARAGGGRQRRDELGVAVLRQERMRVAHRCRGQSPQILATAQPGDQVVDHVGRERAGDPCFEVALGPVVEQRSCRLDLGRRVAPGRRPASGDGRAHRWLPGGELPCRPPLRPDR